MLSRCTSEIKVQSAASVSQTNLHNVSKRPCIETPSNISEETSRAFFTFDGMLVP